MTQAQVIDLMMAALPNPEKIQDWNFSTQGNVLKKQQQLNNYGQPTNAGS